MPLDLEDPEVKEAFDVAVQQAAKTATDSAIEEATKELKNKNEEVIGEKRKLTEKLSKFEGLDLDQLSKYQDVLEKNEEARLIAEGKTDEVIERKLERIRNDYEAKINDLAQERDEKANIASDAERRANQTIIEINLRRAAEVAGVIPSAIDDVIARGSGTFSVDDDASLIQRDKDGNIKTIDGKNATPDVWLKDLQEKAPHFWPASQGAGLQGGDGPGGRSAADEMLAKAAASGDMASYRAMRDKQRGITKE